MSSTSISLANRLFQDKDYGKALASLPKHKPLLKDNPEDNNTSSHKHQFNLLSLSISLDKALLQLLHVQNTKVPAAHNTNTTSNKQQQLQQLQQLQTTVTHALQAYTDALLKSKEAYLSDPAPISQNKAHQIATAFLNVGVTKAYLSSLKSSPDPTKVSSAAKRAAEEHLSMAASCFPHPNPLTTVEEVRRHLPGVS